MNPSAPAATDATAPSNEPSVVASVPALAAGIAHELNNATGLLFAALEYLDNPAGMQRARGIVEEACANAQVLAAALTLLTLEAADIALLTGGQHRFRLSTDDLERVQERLAEVTGVPLSVPRGALDTPLSGILDRSLLQAMLIAMAARRQRQAPPGVQVHARFACSGADADGVRASTVTFTTADEAPATGNRATLDRLLDDALARATRLLAPAGVTVQWSAATDTLAFTGR